jgi:hypothetical protein
VAAPQPADNIMHCCYHSHNKGDVLRFFRANAGFSMVLHKNCEEEYHHLSQVLKRNTGPTGRVGWILLLVYEGETLGFPLTFDSNSFYNFFPILISLKHVKPSKICFLEANMGGVFVWM